MKLNIGNIKNFLFLLFLFVLPWQTRLIYQAAYIGNDFWEYNSLSLYGTEILLGVTVLLFLIEKIRGNIQEFFTNNFNKKRLLLVLLGLFFILSLYLLKSSNRAVTWQYLNWFIYGACLFFMVLESKINFKKISLWVWLGGLLQSFIVIWQFFNQYIPANKWLGMATQDPYQLGVAVIESESGRWLRAYGAFGWPNSSGIYLATIFLLGIILVWQEKNKNVKFCYLVGQLMLLAGLFFTFARGAWMATVVGLAVVSIKKYKEKFFWQQLGIYFVGLLIMLLIFKPLVFSRLNFQNRLEKESISQRVTQWTEFQHVVSKNYLVGSTPGSYTQVLHDLYPKYFVGDLKPVHNIYLLFIAEWGVIGLILLIWFFVNFKSVLNLSFAPLSVLLIAGLFDHWSVSAFSGLMFFAIIVGLSIKYIGIDTKVSQE